MAVHSAVVQVPARFKYVIRPSSNTEWKVTTIATHGPSFHMYFGTVDANGNLIAETGYVLTDNSNLRTEIHLSPTYGIVFYNDNNKSRHGFYSAIES